MLDCLGAEGVDLVFGYPGERNHAPVGGRRSPAIERNLLRILRRSMVSFPL